MDTRLQSSSPRIGTRSDGSHYLRRPRIFTALLALPTVIAYLSWSSGGVPFLTDLAFGLMSVIVFAAMFYELANFHRYFSIAGPVFYGGVLVWFSQDYFDRWPGYDGGGVSSEVLGGGLVTPEVLAKGVFVHMVLIMSVSAGLLIPYGRWAERVFTLVPEPPSRRAVLYVIAFGAFIGLVPYQLFTAEPIWEALYREIFSSRGYGATWVAGRTGNLNFNLGGYMIEMIKFGRMISILAAFYLVFLARSNVVRVLLAAYWLIWLGLAFGDGTRGHVAAVGLPMAAFLFIRFQAQVSLVFNRISKRAWVGTAVILFLVLFIVQFQGHTRGKINTTEEILSVDVTELELTEFVGNHMFSVTLTGMALIPEAEGFFANRFPGEGLVRAIPNTALIFAIGPIPRALWTGKPVDELNTWYSNVVLGSDDGAEGTTISTGLAGYWYFRYGLLGLIQGGLLVGWLYGVSERVFQNARGRMMPMLLSIMLIVVLFRCFRSFWEHQFYPVLIAAVMITILIKTYQLFTGQPSARAVLRSEA